MIRKILSPVNQAITHIQDWADEKLRHLCGRMTPEIRLAVILLMFLFFGDLSIYFTVSSIYRMKRGWRNPADRTYQAATTSK